MPYPVAPVNNIGFIIIVIIGAIAAYGVAAVLRRALSLKYFKQYPEAKDLLGLGIAPSRPSTAGPSSTRYSCS
ncbi:MAG: hypothetical protein JHC13_05840 [Acidilobus sp.]|nr:hypothetical protein [Acidilobus sp.]